MLVRLIGLVLLLVVVPSTRTGAQHFARRASESACRCESPGKPRKPRFLLPIAGGIGILPVSIAARDSATPLLSLPTLVDIRDDIGPRNALEGERALQVGALAPDTATVLPTLILIAAMLVSFGGYLLLPRGRRTRTAHSAWRSRLVPGARGGWRLRRMHRRRLGGGLTAAGGILLVLGTREYAEVAQA